MWALLPIKSFARAKQRLGEALAPQERSELARAMARDVLGALAGCDRLERVVVISGDESARALAEAAGAEFLGEPPSNAGGLNASIKHAVEHFRAAGATAIMIVHGDLPMIQAEDLRRVADAHPAQGRAVTLVPDRALDGTNVLAWSPITEFRAQYGRASFQRHREQAIRRGARVTVCESARGSLDIDLPADLIALLRSARDGQAEATRRYLRQSGLEERLLGRSEARPAFSLDGH